MRMIVALTSAVVLLTAIGVIVMAMRASPQPVWFLAAFEAVTAVAAIMGAAGSREQDGLRLAVSLACVAGGIALCSALGAFGAGWVLGSHSLKPLLAGRLCAAGVIGAAAAWCVLRGNVRMAMPRLLLGTALGVVFALMVGAAWVSRARIGAASVGVRFMGGTIAMLFAIGVLAASVHLVIAAFSAGAGLSEQPER